MTPEAENALIALAVATCDAEHEVSAAYGEPDGGATLICGWPQGHGGPLHYDPVDSVLWAAVRPQMNRDEAAELARTIRQAVAS